MTISYPALGVIVTVLVAVGKFLHWRFCKLEDDLEDKIKANHTEFDNRIKSMKQSYEDEDCDLMRRVGEIEKVYISRDEFKEVVREFSTKLDAALLEFRRIGERVAVVEAKQGT